MPSQMFVAEDAGIPLNSLLSELQDIGLITWNGEGRITSLSESCRRLMQLPLSIKVGGPISILWQSPYRAFMQAFENASEQAQNGSLEKELQLSRDGERYWLSLKVRPCPTSCGKPPAYFLLVRDITHKRPVMQSAKQPRDLFETAFRRMPGAAILESIFHQLSFALGVIDTNRHFVQMSTAALALFGYTQKEIVGQPMRMIYGSDEAFEQAGRQLFVNKPLAPIVADLTAKSGKAFKGRLRHSPFYDATHQLIGYLISFEDVTEQLAHIEILRRYERMVSASSDALVFLDRDHLFQAVNEAYLALWRKQRHEVIGRPIAEIVGEAFYDRVCRPALARCVTGEAVNLPVTQISYPSGAFYMETTYNPYRDESGAISGILITLHDVTERYLAEQALQESEEKFRAIFEHAPIGIGILDRQDGHVLDINAAGVQMLGYPREEVMRLRPWDITDGMTREAFLASTQRTHKQGRASFESTHRKKDGTPLQVLVHAESMTLQGRSVQLMMVTEITRQKQLEARLREREEQYRSLVQSTSAILFSADPETFQFTFVSQEAESLLGYPHRQWLDERSFWVTHIHPDDRIWAPEFCLKSTRNRQDHSFDYRMIAADGRIVWLHTVISVVMQGECAPSLVGVMVDISEHKRAEEDRRRLSEIVKQSSDAILLTDAAFHITYINEAFHLLYGYTQEELRGQKPNILIAQENAQEIKSQIEGALRSGERVSREMCCRRKDGSLFTCQHNISPLRNEAGEIIAYMSSQRDVSLTVEAARALRKSEERYRQIVETAQEGIWVVDAQYMTTFVNPSMARMLGYTETEMCERSLFDFMDEVASKQAKQRLEKRRQGLSAGSDFCFLHKAGREIWTRVSANPLYDETGVYIGAMAMIDDISETRNLQNALISVQKMEAVGQLTGGIAHDFNNILGSILGFTELAKDRFGGHHEKLREYLRQIEIAGGRARDLIRQLMIFSRGENTQAATSIPLAPLVQEIVSMLGAMLPAKVEIRTELSPDSPQVIIDPLHVQQLLMNLCINARDAIDGAGVITITLALRRAEYERCSICNQTLGGEWVSLRVSDTGRGIPTDLQGEIFQPFVTSKGVGEGSGMGLAVVRGILSSYEAHLKVTSTPGQGASFEILFIPGRASSGEKNEIQGASATPLSLKGRRILVVDDELQILAYFDALFSELGAEVICCSNGDQVLRTFSRVAGKFDLVVTDEAMPGMKGSELVQQLRAQGCGVPVILCSGYCERLTEAQAQAQKIVAQLRKPVKKAELLAVIEPLFSAKTLNAKELGY